MKKKARTTAQRSLCDTNISCMWQYDLDGNHELDEEEFVKLVSDLIDGTAKLPMAAQKSAEKVAARGIVMSMDDLFGSDDEAPPAKGKPAPKPAAKPPAPSASKAAAPSAPAKAAAGPLPAAEASKLRQANAALQDENAKLSSRVAQLEAQLAKAGPGTKRQK